MRRTRWLILAAISLLVFVVGTSYVASVERARREAPARPQPLREGIEGTAEGWHYSHSEAGCPVFEARAAKNEQITEPASFNLEGVAIKLFRECGKSADEVKSAKAQFDAASGVMFSEGQVEITMGVPAEGEKPAGRLMKIISSGVRFDTKTGKASTEREVQFGFDKGEGKAVGAEYDPGTRQLHLKSGVDLLWKGKNAKSVPMRIETGDLVYREQDSLVSLSPWARLTRDKLHMESESSIVTLEEGIIRKVEAQNARGIQQDNARKVEYSAAQMVMAMDENGQVTKIDGTGSARLQSVSPVSQTRVTSNFATMVFAATEEDSVLTSSIASGNAQVESMPVARAGAPAPDTRILRSETIELRMRPGGEEIENVQTLAPGTVDFIPNRTGQPRRSLSGDRISIAYGPANAIESFTSTNARTRTDNPPRKAGEKRPPVLTSSKDLRAWFDPKTQQLAKLEQDGDFRYEEGDRKAKSSKATLDQPTDTMTLNGEARAWDPTGSTAADRIVMNQKSGDVLASGRVNSTRMPDKKDGANPAMLSGDEPMQATADKMTTSNQNQRIVYEGHAVAWQGANRIEAARIDIDRATGTLRANGGVVSRFVERAKPAPGKTAAVQTAYTVVRAPAMVYTDKDRLAHYTGGAVMTRPNLTVKAAEIRAWMNDSSAETSIQKAFADGSVVIDQSTTGRTRVGASEHAEYYAEEGRLHLTGGQPEMRDSAKGTTKGRELTYFANDDRLLVNGAPAQRSESLVRRKK